MAKRYSEEEKRRIISLYLASGQSCAAYSRACGVSAITLRSWQTQFGANPSSGFVALTPPLSASGHIFRLSLGSAVLEFDGLPPVEWLSGLVKLVSR
jgi:transposase-like protein